MVIISLESFTVPSFPTCLPGLVFVFYSRVLNDTGGQK